MPLTISNIVVTSEGDKVVAVDWTYSNDDGKRSNRWKLEQPYGDVPLKDCTEGVLLGWLNEQWPEGTIASLDRVIAEDKARREFEATESNYQPHDAGPPTPVTMPAPVAMPAPVPDEPVKAVAKSKKK